MENQLPAKPTGRGPGRPRRDPVQYPSQPVKIAPKQDVGQQDNSHSGDQQHYPHSQSCGMLTANASSGSTSTGYAQQDILVPKSLICVGTTAQHLHVMWYNQSPPTYRVNITIEHGSNGSSLNLPNMALISRHWPDRCFISAEWLDALGLQAAFLPNNEPLVFETPQGSLLACRQVNMFFSLPHLQYGSPWVPVQAIVLEQIGSGVAVIFGGSWVDVIFNEGKWRSGGASAMGFIHSYGP
ncbi:hypothetical protein B0T20DRAFT_128981 [Sordaria brevicollis]|uniref:Uncharacterized protein n=1 Tax=Sordaria brevicollis TaxID=83679 RepID=A0AAE0PLE5_SORBR|nr:hypothetical protein B0T20DRAFT_128981 [Sordaria brevicollis]